MANKVDITEVTEFSNDLQEAAADIRSQLDGVKENIEKINGMSSFSGKAAKEAKTYFSELHGTILESFKGLFDDLENNLQQHIKTFESDVDVSDSAIINSDYLQDVKEEVNEVFEKLEKQDEIIHDTIQEVSDISSATPPPFSDVAEWKKKSVKKVTELDEDLASFNSVGDETDVKAIMNQIETAMNNATASEGKARFADFEGASDGSALAELKGYNEDKKEEQMEKAKDVKDSTIKGLDKTSSKDVVNKAYQEFKDGDITYDQYTAIVDSVKNTSGNMSEEKIKENATDSFIEYLDDRGMLEDYLEEHATVAEQVKIDNLNSEGKGYLDRIDEAYKNGEINKADYEELHSTLLNKGTEATVKLLAEKLPDEENDSDADDDDSSVLGETITRILNGGASVTSKTLQDIAKSKGYEKIAATINQNVADRTLHFRNLGGVAQFAGGGDSLVPLLPHVSSGAVRAGAKYLPSFIGSFVDYNVQVHVDGENKTDAAVKAGAHGVISAIGGAVGFAVGGPIGGVLLGAGIGYLGSEGFDAIYDNAGDIWEGAKNFIGDAASGITDGLGSIFG